MNKKHLFLIFSAFALSLSACSGDNHEHTYSSEWTHDEQYHWHASTCGHDVRKDVERHTFTDVVTEPTYEAGGYTTHTCEICGYYYVDSETEKLVDAYDYFEYKDGIKLSSYNLGYSPVVEVPTEYLGQKVIGIAAGCYKKKTVTLKTKDAEPEEQYTTYVVSSEIEEIDEGTFDEDSTFVTDSETKNEGWKDSSMTGSATENEGNVYFNSDNDSTVYKDGCVYVKSKAFDDYFLARCLSAEKTINIASEIGEKKVVYVGERSFYKNNHVETVNIPYTIGTIYTYAFKGCDNLKEVNFNCPNLSIIKPQAFSYCTGLDVIHLPENLTKLSSKVLSDCGTISEVYIPATAISIADDVFYNTVVEKIIFGGSKEKWDMVMELCKCTNVSQIPVECLDTSGTIELSSVTELEQVPNGKTIKVRGILCGYTKYDKSKYDNQYHHQFAMIKDKNSNYSVTGYNGFIDDLAMTYDPSWIGREVECTGGKSIFSGSLQITNIQFTLTEDETIYDITPATYDFESGEFVVGDHVGEYIHYEGKYLGKKASVIYEFENLDFNIVYFSLDYPTLGKTIEVNDVVSFNFWVDIYNQGFQGMPDLNSLVLVE